MEEQKLDFFNYVMIFLLLIIASIIAAYISNFIISYFVLSGSKTLLVSFIASFLTSLIGVVFASPAIIMFAYPICIALVKENKTSIFVWLCSLTLVALIYSIPWAFVESKFEPLAVCAITGTGFLTSLFCWLFICRLKLYK